MIDMRRIRSMSPYHTITYMEQTNTSQLRTGHFASITLINAALMSKITCAQCASHVTRHIAPNDTLNNARVHDKTDDNTTNT
jgi:hypothetical protein